MYAIRSYYVQNQASVWATSAPASAAITLYDEDGTTFSADGYVNAFYVSYNFV